MDRQDLITAAMGASKGAVFTPVQIQKMFFVIDERAASFFGGKKFAFEPYDYGPFDASVYTDLESLEASGLVYISKPLSGLRTYQLTTLGQDHADKLLSTLDAKAVSFLTRISDFVRKLSFAQLVSAIYKEWPEMKAKSIFRGDAAQ